MSPTIVRGIDWLGFSLQERRLKLRLSQRDVAQRAGITQTGLSLIENGRRNLGYLTLEQLAKALRCKIVITPDGSYVEPWKENLYEQ